MIVNVQRVLEDIYPCKHMKRLHEKLPSPCVYEFKNTKKIHQVWIGEEDIFEHCVKFTKKIQDVNSDYEYKLWRNEIFELYKDDVFLQEYIKAPAYINGNILQIELNYYCYEIMGISMLI